MTIQYVKYEDFVMHSNQEFRVFISHEILRVILTKKVKSGLFKIRRVKESFQRSNVHPEDNEWKPF
jgi:hypothetical protein